MITPFITGVKVYPLTSMIRPLNKAVCFLGDYFTPLVTWMWLRREIIRLDLRPAAMRKEKVNQKIVMESHGMESVKKQTTLRIIGPSKKEGFDSL